VSLVVGTLLACGSIREDEFLCENAVSHLHECCPVFNGSIACNYDPGCLESTYPDLDPTQSNCILAQPCDVLRQSGLCELAGHTPSTGLFGDDGSASPVCTQPAAPVDAGAPPVSVGVACMSASDCTVPGEVCCVTSVAPSIGRTCARFPCIQSCLSTQECSSGRVCTDFDAFGGISMVCVLSDASTAIPDAQSTAPDVDAESTAPDAGASEDDAAADGGFTRADAADAMSDAPVDGGGE
jgi:hypothetical protein